MLHSQDMPYNMHSIWLPYCQMKTAAPPLLVKSANGCRIILEDGRELIDGIASWWSMCHGYNHPYIISEVEKQLHLLPHVMLGGLVHNQAVNVARRLIEITPQNLSHVFFSDSGSVAVEVALKMTLQYWRLRGRINKDRFVCFANGYHGDTLGAMSVSDPEHSLHKAFRNSVIKQYVMTIPNDEYSFSEFEATIKAISGNVAGIIIEPLVQGAGGMKFHSADILAEIYRVCKKHEILFIADEIATGFYRTGNLFACDEAGIVPDIMCLGKALTAGTVGLGATIATEEIFSAFLSDKKEDALMHGPTFMGNPLACAAANASLDLFSLAIDSDNITENSAKISSQEKESWRRKIELIEEQLTEELAPCRNFQSVVDVRVKGAIGVVQLNPAINLYALRNLFIEQGVWLRPFGDIIYIMPPLIISNNELTTLTSAIKKVIAAKC